MKILIEESVLRQALEALEEVEDLIGESSGVYGLHLNGDPSPWDELIAGGRFERLVTLNDASKTLRTALDAAEKVEPVIWKIDAPDAFWFQEGPEDRENDDITSTPLYTHPAPARNYKDEIERLRKERDELVAALKRIIRQQETIGQVGNSAWTTADAALAKVGAGKRGEGS